MSEIDEILKFDPIKNISKSDKTEDTQKDIISEILKFDPIQSKKDVSDRVLDLTRTIEPNSNLSWGNTLTEAFSNIPSSAWEMAKNVVTPIIHPIETGKTIGKIALGGGEKLVSGKQENEQYFDAMVDFFKNRYGSEEGFKKALAEDPIGILSDAASVVTGSGAAVKVAGTLGGVSKLATTGKALTTIGGALEPLNIARGIAAVPLRLVPESIPINMYQSAVKFGTTLGGKERDEITRTALKASNQIMPTSKGMEKLRGLIDDYNEKISGLINDSVNKGEQIPVDRLFEGLDILKGQFKRISDQPGAWDKAFNAMSKEWENMLKVGEFRTPHEVQKIKTRIYKDLESFYEQHKSTPAKTELRKAVARNSRESLEAIIPEIKQLNKEEGALLELWDAIESKSNRITNRDLIGIGLPVKMGTGSGIGYMFAGTQGAAVGSALGFALGVFDTPQVKAKIALVLNRLREKGITIKPSRAAMELGLYQIGREGEFIINPEQAKQGESPQ